MKIIRFLLASFVLASLTHAGEFWTTVQVEQGPTLPAGTSLKAYEPTVVMTFSLQAEEASVLASLRFKPTGEDAMQNVRSVIVLDVAGIEIGRDQSIDAAGFLIGFEPIRLQKGKKVSFSVKLTPKNPATLPVSLGLDLLGAGFLSDALMEGSLPSQPPLPLLPSANKGSVTVTGCDYDALAPYGKVAHIDAIWLKSAGEAQQVKTPVFRLYATLGKPGDIRQLALYDLGRFVGYGTVTAVPGKDYVLATFPRSIVAVPEESTHLDLYAVPGTSFKRGGSIRVEVDIESFGTSRGIESGDPRSLSGYRFLMGKTHVVPGPLAPK